MRRLLLALAVLCAVAGVAHQEVALAAGAGPSSRVAAGRAWLGVAMGAKSDGPGVLVRHVVRGSPAEKAGVKDGDSIVAIDGTRVAAADEVTRLVAGHQAGDTVVAVLSRGSESLTLRVTLSPRPAGDEMLRMDRVGAFAPAWVGVEPVGAAPASVAALRGNVVVLDFWATWCGPCRLLAPKLSALQSRYGAQGLRVVGLTTDPAEKAALFAQRFGMSYPVAIDAKGETSSAYAVSALPTLFVIDKRGVVRDVAIGYDPDRDAQIESLLKDLLAEPAPAN